MIRFFSVCFINLITFTTKASMFCEKAGPSGRHQLEGDEEEEETGQIPGNIIK